MSISAREENAKTLAKLLGVDDDEAAALLDMQIAVRAGTDACSQSVRRHLVALLERSVGGVGENLHGNVAVEILIGEIASTMGQPVVRVGVTKAVIGISCEAAPDHERGVVVPEILLLIGACYAAGMAVRLGIGDRFPLPSADTIQLPLEKVLRGGINALAAPVDIGTAYLAGAGAIGNGFLHALALVDARGTLDIVDPKRVTAGNLGRCPWFLAQDIGQWKAEALAARAQPKVQGLKLVPRVGRLQDLEERSAGPWLERLIVAVDSRRARRHLQEELPCEVFDASTTGIEEVVIHFNSARSDGACLSCIYEDDQVEAAHERHVASMLGVDVAEVRNHYIDLDAARRIAARHPQLHSSDLVGTAYDSLFKSLCATGQLGVEEGRTVLAPFSFVSVLAGAYLALELVLRASSKDVSRPFNYWRASPWTSPVFELKNLRPARPKCETCGNAVISETVKQLWGWGGEEAS